MEIQIPSSFSELNSWQKEEICFLLLQDNEYFEQKFIKILDILIRKNNSKAEKRKSKTIFSQVSVSHLSKFANFVYNSVDLFVFPEISDTLQAPAPRLSDISIKQFSVSDAIFYQWKTQKMPEIYAQQLVAVLYKQKNTTFDSAFLPKIAEITDAISPKKRAEICFAYLCTRQYIVNKYPKIFQPKSLKNEGEKPVFTKTNKYIPFSKLILEMALHEKQPLGNLHECNQTKLYDFLDIFNELL